MLEQNQAEIAIVDDARGWNNLVLSVCSLLVPCLGQLFQRRIGAFIGQLIFLTVAIVCFYHFGVIGLILHIPLMIYSVLDAAFWTGNKKARPSKWIRRTGVPICCFAMIVTLLTPAIIAAREAAKRMQCSCTFKQLALALHNYHDQYHCFPPAYTVDENGRPLHSWRVLILPFMEQQELYEKIRLDEPWDSEYNRQFHSINIGTFQCPSAEDVLYRRYPNLRQSGNCFKSVVIGNDTIFPGAKSTTLEEITDGTSNTILIVERFLPICWMDPNNEISMGVALHGINREYSGMGSFHDGIINTAFADGSVQSLPENIRREKLEAYLTIAGGEKLEDTKD